LASKFATDIAAVTKAGLDPNVIAKLLAEGPAKAEPALQSMLSGNTSTMIKMVNQGEASLAAINQRVIEQARLTSMAVNSQSDQMSKDFSAAMQIDNAIATSGGKATVASLAAQLHLGAGDVKRVAAEFGIGIADGVAGGVTPAKVTIQSLQDKIDSIKQHGLPGISANSKAAQVVIAGLQAQIDALRQKTPPAVDANPATAQAKIKDLQAKIDAIKQGKVPGLNANSAAADAKVAALQAQIDALKQKKPPGLDANSAAGKAAVAGLQSQIDDVKQHGVPGMDTDTGVARQKVAELQSVIDGITGKTVAVVIQYTANGVNLTAPSSVGRKAAGGPISGPGTGTSDSVPILASNGEHMLTASDVSAAGGHAAIFAYRKSLHAYAVGGPITGQALAAGGPLSLPVGISPASQLNLLRRVLS
jgi:hypothetical protein